jgi:hypothetical protein
VSMNDKTKHKTADYYFYSHLKNADVAIFDFNREKMGRRCATTADCSVAIHQFI